MRLNILSLLSAALVLFSVSHAYFNVTYLNTTVTLNTTTTAHVVEKLGIYVSNSSIATYETDRQAINLTLSGWQKALGTSQLVEHILPPGTSVQKFTLLPGPIVNQGNNGGDAAITFSYDALNVTSIQNVAPRKFDYIFNNTVFNFQHTASGQELSQNTRLTIIIPSGAEVVSVYPAPDSPLSNFVGNYTNVTTFSWYSGEPLSKFSFSYILTESLQQEVTNYMGAVYKKYGVAIWVLVFILVVAGVMYAYFRYTR